MNSSVEKSSGKRVLVVDDDEDFQHELRRMLISNGMAGVESASSGMSALELLARGNIGVVLLDMVMPGICGTELLTILVQRYPAIPVIMITAVSDINSVVSCIKLGAFDYLTKPLDVGRLFATVTRAISFSELCSQNRQLRDYLLGEPLSRPEIFASIVTVNSRMKSIFKLVEIIAPTQHPVLGLGPVEALGGEREDPAGDEGGHPDEGEEAPAAAEDDENLGEAGAVVRLGGR